MFKGERDAYHFGDIGNQRSFSPAYANNLIWLGVVFFIISLVAYVLGARGVAGMSAGLGRTLLIVGVVLAIVVIVFGYVGHPA